MENFRWSSLTCPPSQSTRRRPKQALLTESHWHPAAPSFQPQLQLKPSFQLPQREGDYNPCVCMEGNWQELQSLLVLGQQEGHRVAKKFWEWFKFSMLKSSWAQQSIAVFEGETLTKIHALAWALTLKLLGRSRALGIKTVRTLNWDSVAVTVSQTIRAYREIVVDRPSSLFLPDGRSS